MKLSTCGICGSNIKEDEDFYSSPVMDSAYSFCSKKCIRTAILKADSIDQLMKVVKIVRELSNG